MSAYTRHIKSVITFFIFAGICLLCFPTAAQHEPQNKQGTISDDDFVKLNQQIKELKNPAFRAFLTIRLLSWESPQPGPMRRQAAMEVATQGVTDLCEHQDEIWQPTASWLHESFVKRIKDLQPSEDTALEICVFKTVPTSNVAKDFSSGIRMLSDPETSAAGIDLAKSAILSGQVSASALLGRLSALEAAHSPQLPELLSAVVLLEEKQPGALPLKMMPLFTSMFLQKSVPPETLTRYLSVAVRSSRRSAEELANPMVRVSVAALLNGIISAAQRLTPALYPEIASRLSSLNRTAPNRTEMRLAAEERIQRATDQLEQLISEANSASDEQLKTHFFFRAARLAREQGQLSKAVDLAMKIAKEDELDNDERPPTWVSNFLSEIALLAVNRESPSDVTYAISKMTRFLAKAQAFTLLGEYYGANQDKAKSKEAFTQAAKQLKSVANNNGKVRISLSLAESLLKYEPADAYEVFREAVKAINNLPSPEKDQENRYYEKLFPIAEDLIRSFRLLAALENQTATSLAAEIKLSELRLSALSGAHSGHAVIADKKSNQE